MKKAQNYKNSIGSIEDKRLSAATIDGAFVFGLYIYVIFVLSNRGWFKAFLVEYNQMALVVIRGILAFVVFLLMEALIFLDIGKVFGRQGTVLCLPSLLYYILYDYLDIIFISYGYFSKETKRE